MKSADRSGMRNRMMPQDGRGFELQAISPKSLYKCKQNVFSSARSRINTILQNCVGIDSFRFHQGTGVAETGLDVFMSQSWVVIEYLGLGPAIGQKVDDKFHCQARAFDYGFSHKDFGVRRYAVLPNNHRSYYVGHEDIFSAG
jgi:hypothetical protein